jgi:hypothetical protein
MTDRPSGNDPNDEPSAGSSPNAAEAPAKPSSRRGSDTLPDAPQSKRNSIPIVGPTPNQSAEYVEARLPPQPTPHKTIELEPVKVTAEADPRRAATLPSLAKQKAGEGSDPIPLISKPRRAARSGAEESLGSLAPHESDSSAHRDASYIEGARRALGAVRWLVIGASLALVVALFALTYALLNRTPVAVRSVSSSDPEPRPRREASPTSRAGAEGLRVVIPTPPSPAIPKGANAPDAEGAPAPRSPPRAKGPRAERTPGPSSQKPQSEPKAPKADASSVNPSSPDLWLE